MVSSQKAVTPTFEAKRCLEVNARLAIQNRGISQTISGS